jgi:hypothetical protein
MKQLENLKHLLLCVLSPILLSSTAAQITIHVQHPGLSKIQYELILLSILHQKNQDGILVRL